jgi:hypothetical protein
MTAVILLLAVIALAGAGVLGVPEKLVARQARRRARVAKGAPAGELSEAALEARDDLPVVDTSRRPRRPRPPAQLPPAPRPAGERAAAERRPATERGGSRM